MEQAPSSWLPVVILLIIGIGFAVGNIAISLLIGPRRTGPGKETTYESGMMPIGDTRRRFNVRFYIVAMIFLVIDVDIIFFYPFATIFAPYVRANHAASGMMLIVAFALTALGFCIAWRMSSTQGFHAIMNLFLMPMWFLSGALFPLDNLPSWLGVLTAADPATYGVDAMRNAMLGVGTYPAALDFAVLTAYTAALGLFGIYSFGRMKAV